MSAVNGISLAIKRVPSVPGFGVRRLVRVVAPARRHLFEHAVHRVLKRKICEMKMESRLPNGAPTPSTLAQSKEREGSNFAA